MDELKNAALAANVRAAAKRIMKTQGVDAQGFAAERLKAATDEGEANEMLLWQSIIAELTKV